MLARVPAVALRLTSGHVDNHRGNNYSRLAHSAGRSDAMTTFDPGLERQASGRR